MRIAGSSEHEDFWVFKIKGDCKVFFNGVDMSERIIVADDEAGMIEIYMKTPDGEIVQSNGRFVIERLFGKVEIVGERWPWVEA